MANWLQKQWLGFTVWHLLLLPISWVFAAIVSARKLLYQKGWLESYRLSIPVIVVGNINVGGTGKTPLVIWLAEQLQLAGYQPGIISRGYGGDAQHITEVFASSQPQQVGDEPVLIASRVPCPVFVGADRVAAGQSLIKAHPECNIIISDDGLQHYRLQRDVEIVVFDGARGFGNGTLLPAGSLREPKARLKKVDVLVSNGSVRRHDELSGLQVVEMRLESDSFYKLADYQLKADTSTFINKKITAVAGIGNPERFFQQLRRLDLNFESVSYPDHHAFRAADLEGLNTDIILMTEKDAVKCKSFAQPNYWVLPVNAVINNELMTIILNKLNIARK